MKLECDICKQTIRKKTEELYLVNVNGHDSLLCDFHASEARYQRGVTHENRSKDS